MFSVLLTLSKRILRVNSLIRDELSQIFLREIDFPEGVLVTVTDAETSIDISNVKVYISVMPEAKTEKIFAILKKIIYYIQQTLNKRLKMRVVPKIRFLKDKKIKEIDKIERIFEKIKKEKN